MNKKQKQLTQVFIFLFIFSFIAVNWNDVSWLFNYRAMGDLTYQFFNPYQQSDMLVSANNKNTSTPTIAPPPPVIKEYPYSAKSNSIEIVSLGVDAPIVIGQSTDKAIVTKELDNGAVYYPGSVLPGQDGQIVILGHSAPPNWPRIKYDYIFSKINDLVVGDQIILHFNNRQYTYKVIDKQIIKKGAEVGSTGLTENNNILTLISCWPPGKDYQRIAVTTELIEN